MKVYTCGEEQDRLRVIVPIHTLKKKEKEQFS